MLSLGPRNYLAVIARSTPQRFPFDLLNSSATAVEAVAQRYVVQTAAVTDVVRAIMRHGSPLCWRLHFNEIAAA